MKAIDLTNQRFGRLIALFRLPPEGKEGVRWMCKCDCGNDKIVIAKLLRQNHTRSCGCGRGGLGDNGKRRVAINGAWRSPTYKTWANMMKRCDPERSLEPLYVGYGMCDRWKDFELFLLDMGQKPSADFSIDRIDNSKGYSPENCRWADKYQQANNRSTNHLIEFNGRIQTMAQWANQCGMSIQTLSSRINTKKWPIDKALTEPIRFTGRHHSPKVPPLPR